MGGKVTPSGILVRQVRTAVQQGLSIFRSFLHFFSEVMQRNVEFEYLHFVHAINARQQVHWSTSIIIYFSLLFSNAISKYRIVSSSKRVNGERSDDFPPMGKRYYHLRGSKPAFGKTYTPPTFLAAHAYTLNVVVMNDLVALLVYGTAFLWVQSIGEKYFSLLSKAK